MTRTLSSEIKEHRIATFFRHMAKHITTEIAAIEAAAEELEMEPKALKSYLANHKVIGGKKRGRPAKSDAPQDILTDAVLISQGNDPQMTTGTWEKLDAKEFHAAQLEQIDRPSKEATEHAHAQFTEAAHESAEKLNDRIEWEEKPIADMSKAELLKSGRVRQSLGEVEETARDAVAAVKKLKCDLHAKSNIIGKLIDTDIGGVKMAIETTMPAMDVIQKYIYPEPEEKPARRIYLAGAIHHVTPEFATEWRKKAARELTPYGYAISDPTADKDLYHANCNTALYTPEYIVETDLANIAEADILLVEMSRKDVPYCGTSMEVRQAYLDGKIIIVWGGTQSYWARYHANLVVGTLDEALWVLKQMGRVCEAAKCGGAATKEVCTCG